MASEWQQPEGEVVGVQRRYLWVVEDIATQPALLPWVVEDRPLDEPDSDIVRVNGEPLAELKRTRVPRLPAGLIQALRQRATELHEQVRMQGDSDDQVKVELEGLQKRVALLEELVREGDGRNVGGGGGGGGDGNGGHHTHRGPLYYADSELFKSDLHASLQQLADEWWPSVTPDQVAERMGQPISKGTLANRLRENGMLENRSLTWTVKKLYAQHRKKLV